MVGLVSTKFGPSLAESGHSWSLKPHRGTGAPHRGPPCAKLGRRLVARMSADCDAPLSEPSDGIALAIHDPVRDSGLEALENVGFPLRKMASVMTKASPERPVMADGIKPPESYQVAQKAVLHCACQGEQQKTSVLQRRHIHFSDMKSKKWACPAARSLFVGSGVIFGATSGLSGPRSANFGRISPNLKDFGLTCPGVDQIWAVDSTRFWRISFCIAGARLGQAARGRDPPDRPGTGARGAGTCRGRGLAAPPV